MVVVIHLLAAVFTVIGLRLIRSARSVSGAEGWLGAAFLCMAGSMALRVLVPGQQIGVPQHGPFLVMVSHALMSAGLCAFTLFVSRVFRSGSAGGTVVLGVMLGLQILAMPAVVFLGAHREEQSLASLLVGPVRALPFAWAALESWRYHRKMRRRLALGLSDPVVTDRFALFAIWTGALGAIPLVATGGRFLARLATESGRLVADEAASKALALGVAGFLVLLAGVAIVALGLSFFPPPRWIERVESRAARVRG